MVRASLPTRLAYCIDLFSLFGLLLFSRATWSGLNFSSEVAVQIVAISIVTAAAATYRIVQVLYDPGRLDAPRAPSGIAATLRAVGIALMYVSATGTVVYFVAPSLYEVHYASLADNGIGKRVHAALSALPLAIRGMGVIFFEFRRLLGFEKHADS